MRVIAPAIKKVFLKLKHLQKYRFALSNTHDLKLEVDPSQRTRLRTLRRVWFTSRRAVDFDARKPKYSTFLKTVSRGPFLRMGGVTQQTWYRTVLSPRGAIFSAPKRVLSRLFLSRKYRLKAAYALQLLSILTSLRFKPRAYRTSRRLRAVCKAVCRKHSARRRILANAIFSHGTLAVRTRPLLTLSRGFFRKPRGFRVFVK
jgi:hypothetical protein